MHVRAQRLIQVVQRPACSRGRTGRPGCRGLLQILDEPLGLRHAALGERDRLVLLVDDVVAGRFERLAVLGFRVAPDDRALLELRNDPVDLVIEVGGFLGRAGNDQRRSRFVDEDAVHLVDDGEVVAALDVVRQLELHVVAQVIEAELVVRAVGDVAGVGDLAFSVVQLVLDDARRSCRGSGRSRPIHSESRRAR